MLAFLKKKKKKKHDNKKSENRRIPRSILDLLPEYHNGNYLCQRHETTDKSSAQPPITIVCLSRQRFQPAPDEIENDANERNETKEGRRERVDHERKHVTACTTERT